MVKADEAQWQRVLKTGNEWVLDQGHPLWTSESAEMAETVEAALAELDERHRDAVVLRVWGRFTFREIAEHMGWPSRGYAWMYYRRGLDKLSGLLGGWFDEDSR